MQTELIATIDAAPLATSEQEALARCEAVIERGVQTFLEVGEALAEIRDAKLYRIHYDTWEEYCQDRWGIGGSRARQLIGASGVARQIETVTTVTLSSERQARELSKSTPEERPAIITRATEIAGERAPTAKHIQQAAAEIAGWVCERCGARTTDMRKPNPAVCTQCALKSMDTRATPDLPPEFAVIKRRFAIHEIALTCKTGEYIILDSSGAESRTRVWDQVLDRLSLLEDGMEDESPAAVAQPARPPAMPPRPRRPVSADVSATVKYLDQLETYASALEAFIMALQKQMR